MNLNHATVLIPVFSALMLSGCGRTGECRFEEPASAVSSTHKSSLSDWLDLVYREVCRDFPETSDCGSAPMKSLLDSLELSPGWPGAGKTHSASLKMPPVEFLKYTVYDRRGVVFDTSRLDPSGLFPRLVWERKKGSCLGIALLVLSLAERIDYPMDAVLLPGHIFLRSGEGDASINFEPNRQGFAYTDAEYRVKYAVGPRSRFRLENLTRDELAGVVLYSVGNIYMERRRNREAECSFRSALRRYPQYGEALGNLGVLYGRMGRTEEGIGMLERARGFLGTDVALGKNLGALYMRAGRFGEASGICLEALSMHPGSSELLLSLGTAYLLADSLERALETVQVLLEREPEDEGALELKRKVERRISGGR